MKKLTLLLLIISLLSINPTNLKADTISDKPPIETSAEAPQLLNRLEEIKEMDKSALTRAEKKELRNEVKSIKQQLRESNGGIYLSVGAVIVIILLLIILL